MADFARKTFPGPAGLQNDRVTAETRTASRSHTATPQSADLGWLHTVRGEMNESPRLRAVHQLKHLLNREARGTWPADRSAALRQTSASLNATARSSTAPPASHSSAPVQRAVVLLDVNKDDYALHKVLTGLNPGKLDLLTTEPDVEDFVKGRKADATRRAMIPYANLLTVSNGIKKRRDKHLAEDVPVIAADEDIHIVGHGRSDRVWTLPQHGGEITSFANLGTWLGRATPPDWSGTTRLLTCNSAREGTGAPTVQDMLSTSLGDKPVTGQAGFAYGMGKGKPVAVLKEKFETLYKGDDYEKEVGKYLTDMAYKAAAAASAIGYAPAKSQLKNEGEWKRVWTLFVKKMNGIQTALQRIVNDTPGDDTLTKARALEQNKEFQSKIGDQYDLFATFKLWRT